MSDRTIQPNFRWGDPPALTNATAATLADAAGTYGIKRNDTNAVVVASGTALTNIGTGQYSHTFTDPGVAMTAWVKWVYGGNTYYEEMDLAASTDTTALTLTYDLLRREIGRFLGYGRDPTAWTGGSDQVLDVADILRSGVRRVLTPPPLKGERYGHEWSFIRPTTSFSTTAPYSTGTIGIVDGVVTLATGTFPAWAAQGSIVVSSGTYPVATRDSNSQLTLVDTTVDVTAGATYELGRTAYDMPSDFADIEGPLVYASGQSMLRQRVERISEHQLLMALAVETSSSYPRRYAIRPKALDLSAATAYEMLLCPTPDDAYALWYKYAVAIPALDGSTNTTPPGGDAHAELYLEACLAAAEQKMHDVAGLHSARFMECLAASVARDRQANAPDTLGAMRDASDGPVDWADPEGHEFTQPDYTYCGSHPLA